MERYDYFAAVCEDIRDYIESEGITVNDENRDEIEERLNDELFVNDSVTGNASGSYTFNRWRAEENLCHNFDLLREACEAFGTNIDILDSPEGADVTIRCYLLAQCLMHVLDEMTESE